ncbi:MAG: ATP-binding domain-containing protein, partial [Pelosinus sp.]|nr:ATP-binding domain-containing protein [Pelosinus sp.]
EIKDVLAYLKVLFNPADTISLLRIINVPRRGIGEATIRKLNDYALKHHMTLFDVVSNPDLATEVGTRAKHSLEGLAELIFNLMGAMGSLEISALIEKIMNDSGYIAELEQEQTPQDEARIENLKELLTVAKEFAESDEENTLENFLSHVSLVSDIDTAELADERVTMMTLHSAKGLEFPIVFLAGMEEGLFPHSRTLMDDREIEEERRICYVGITRAREKLYLSNAKMRTIFGRTTMFPPSRFLGEIPDHMIQPFGRKAPAMQQAPQSINRSGIGVRPQMNVRPSAPHMAQQMQHSSVKPSIGTAAAASGNWRPGDKAQHNKWGVGTVVDVRGVGDTQELKIAFPGQGIKQLMVKFAPIRKV